MSTSSSSNYHHGDLRRVLLSTAMDALAQQGEALSLRQIARCAGVSPTACYRHFSDKEALLAAVAQEGFSKLRESLRQAVLDAGPDAGGKAALKALAVTYVAFAESRSSLFRLMFGPVTVRRSPAHQPEGETAFDVLADVVAALDGPQPRTRAFALGCWSLVHGLAMLTIDGRLAGAGAEQGMFTVETVVEAMLS